MHLLFVDYGLHSVCCSHLLLVLYMMYTLYLLWCARGVLSVVYSMWCTVVCSAWCARGVLSVVYHGVLSVVCTWCAQRGVHGVLSVVCTWCAQRGVSVVCLVWCARGVPQCGVHVVYPWCSWCAQCGVLIPKNTSFLSHCYTANDTTASFWVCGVLSSASF